MTDVKIDIARITPDFDGINQALFEVLRNKNTWEGDLTTQTGTTLIDMITTVGAHAQLKMLRYAQDFYPETSLSNRALYAHAAKSGLRINRRAPASASVTLTSSLPITVPAYSQFSGNGSWFNRESVFVDANTPTVITVHQGQVKTLTTIGGKGDFQVYVSTDADFVVSNDDVRVFANNSSIPVVKDAIYNYQGTPAVQDVTLPTGAMMLVYGSGNTGYVPAASDTLVIQYVVTDGATFNGQNLAGSRLTLTSPQQLRVTGVFDSNPEGGSYQSDTLKYKVLAPAYFGTNGTAVTRDQYYAMALDYPGVTDVYMLAQREIDPSNFQLMNVIKIAILPEPNADGSPVTWTIPQKQEFLRYMEKRSMYACRFEWMTLERKDVSVIANVFAKTTANIPEVQAACYAAVRELFRLRTGSLGFDIARSDIIDAMLESHSGVDYVDLVSPTTDINVNQQYVYAPVLTPTAGTGTVPGVATYSYGIGYDTIYGDVAPKKWGTVAINTPGSYGISVEWDRVAGEVLSAYHIYGRSGIGRYGRLATIPVVPGKTTYTWVDNNTAVPGPAPLLENNFPPLYAYLLDTPETFNISVDYSARRKRI